MGHRLTGGQFSAFWVWEEDSRGFHHSKRQVLALVLMWDSYL